MTISKGIYRANKPDCAHCGFPIEDSGPRGQYAGKVYHTNNQTCYDAYLRAKEGLPS